MPETLPDLSACEREPIHIPGAIEPNGVLLVLEEPGLGILQASTNTGALLGWEAADLLGVPLAEVVDPDSLQRLKTGVLPRELDRKRRYWSGVRPRDTELIFDGLVHRHAGALIVELEPASNSEEAGPELEAALTDALAESASGSSLVEVCQQAATEIRRLTGFDRVMVYRFLPDDTGSVIAEDRRDDLTPYLGLRYPASDIPAQARRLYLLNTLRLTADVNARRARLIPELNPATGQPLDMSYCVLRAMSPIHIEYLQNMGVRASMSVSIVKDERLWGLIACHHTEPKPVPQRIRVCCEAIAHILAARIGTVESEERHRRTVAVHEACGELTERIRSQSDVRASLIHDGDRLVSLLNSGGAAVCIGGEIALAGRTPTREDVGRLAGWLTAGQEEYVFQTDKLADAYPPAERFRDTASGLLSARIAPGSSDFVLWFRPAAVHIIEWGGNPAKPVEETEAGKRISPRLSFERWKETVGDRSEEWGDYEREFALTLRQTIAEALLLQKNAEVTQLNTELERSNIELDAFAYAASHDLQEPVRTIRAYAQLLRRRSADRLDEETLKLIDVIESGAMRMGSLISALLTYGQVGGSSRRERKPVNFEDVLRVVLLNLDDSVRASGAIVTHDPLPTTYADPEQMMQLLQNLVGNSIKYRKPDEAPRVHISASPEDRSWRFSVSDNGQGFAPEDAKLIFDAFKRLHGREVPGTGIGLALCRRIVEHHGGRIWAESRGRGYGATVFFTVRQS